MAPQARGKVTINVDECKGCGLCVESCPPKCLELAEELSSYGVHPAHYRGNECSGCGICFYCCPEPGAITVYRLASTVKARVGAPAGEGVADLEEKFLFHKLLERVSGHERHNRSPGARS
jgi:NAD-dependent dihydropyrimidine dehydrogenase PreA subunit